MLLRFDSRDRVKKVDYVWIISLPYNQSLYNNNADVSKNRYKTSKLENNIMSKLMVVEVFAMVLH
jgi:hypothetical protein